MLEAIILVLIVIDVFFVLCDPEKPFPFVVPLRLTALVLILFSVAQRFLGTK